ncbi:hypothetical protein [Ornithinimicrobium pratense]|uniref:Nuclear transport factor 2 family protein n=1 Tax=Ornithinimicrobium pratense TaxID=2593973 RepID=A0A5J6V3B1_9MICO|nr:hypothetical protein [Ornithinimicrobium pratense]QFG67662.1 hypothetical protein FY030_01995 [Ornithinimicrobium pratense]
MRRTLTAVVASAALLLTACDGDTAADDATAGGTATTDGVAPTTHTPPPEDQEATTAPVDDAAATAPVDNAAVTDEAPATQAPGDDAVMGGEEGQAAAERAKEFLMALVTADPTACDLLLSFSDPERPMTAVPSDLELCQTQLPATMEATVEAQGLGEDGIAVLESMQIRGADVQGDTAVVGRENYSPLFAEAMGDSTITLKRITDEWYVDLDAYLTTE